MGEEVFALFVLRRPVSDSTLEIPLSKVFQFTELMLQFQAVVRKVRIPNRAAEENDAEHSYQLAMMGWYLNDIGRLGLDTNLLTQYALVHDLVEAYAGDIHILDHAGRAGKHEREAVALVRIEAEFGESLEFVRLIRDYEYRQDPESQFVYALDKFMPMVMIYLEGGSTWRELNFSMEELMRNQDSMTAGFPFVQTLVRKLHVLARGNPGMFRRP